MQNNSASRIESAARTSRARLPSSKFHNDAKVKGGRDEDPDDANDKHNDDDETAAADDDDGDASDHGHGSDDGDDSEHENLHEDDGEGNVDDVSIVVIVAVFIH